MDKYIEDIENDDRGVKIIRQENNNKFRFYITKNNVHISEEILKLFNTEIRMRHLRDELIRAIYEKTRCNDRIATILNESETRDDSEEESEPWKRFLLSRNNR